MSLAPAPDGVLPLGALCTGVVCAVRGVDLGEGSFVVSDMCFPGLPPQAPLPTLPPAQAPHVAIVSGLGISRSSSMLLVQHMVDWLAGFSGGEADRRVATSVCRVIVAGGLVSSQSGASGARVAASDPSFVKSLPEGRWAPSGGLDMFVDLQRRADATSRDRADASPSDKVGGPVSVWVPVDNQALSIRFPTSPDRDSPSFLFYLPSFPTALCPHLRLPLPPPFPGPPVRPRSFAHVSTRHARRHACGSACLCPGDGHHPSSPHRQAPLSLGVQAGISNGGVEQGNEVGEGRRAQVADAQPVARGDLLIAELAGRVPVDVMPGRGDPTTASLPQQPMHRCLLPGLARMGGEGGAGGLRATNPYDAEVAGVRVMGTSGQNLHDLWRCTEVDSGIALAGASLAFSHLAPTAPDTLPCYPFSTADPFVIGECPHVLFAGDQPRFETALVEGPQGQRVRVIMVPRFDQTGQVVLVNLGSLETQLLQFDTDLGY